ncbi:uncharacterized protein PRCAT00002172001 [Priceomyces carsonii]|uniref:uncharacterized protein n=1 Tax=Priceomyces carsonii TaxID=28549 RepID=UPI002ED86A73|nr:unnamed protein product [Priceomyces carsonii]
MTISDLDDDTLITIVLFLSPDDVFNFSLTSKAIHLVLTTNAVYRILYFKKFGSKPTPLSLTEYNWKDLFHLRASSKAKLYTWGSSLLGRLGYLINDIPENHTSIGFMSKNVHTPTNVPNFNGNIITDISAGGFSLQILVNNGSLYFTGANWKKSETSKLTPGPFQSHDYTPSPLYALITTSIPHVVNLGSRRLIPTNSGSRMPGSWSRNDRDISESTASNEPRRPTNPNLTLPPEEQSYPPSLESINQKSPKETSFVTKLEIPEVGKTDAKIVSISSGREHIIALDNYHNLYSWDTGNTSKMAVRILFPGLDNKLISKISAGWNLSVCQIDQIGLVVWYSRIPLTEENYINKTMTSEARYVIIPETKHSQIVDFMAGCDYVLIIKGDGRLYRFSINAHAFATGDRDETMIEDLEKVDEFNKYLLERGSEIGKNTRFTKLEGCYNKFVVFTNDGLVLLGQKDLETPKILPELQNRNITSVTIGDYHYLALTSNGEMLSWGTESKQCGCLGLGPKQEIIDNNNGNVNDLGRQNGMEVLRPMKVKRPAASGKWLAAAAAGWHSCGIFVPSLE